MSELLLKDLLDMYQSVHPDRIIHQVASIKQRLPGDLDDLFNPYLEQAQSNCKELVDKGNAILAKLKVLTRENQAELAADVMREYHVLFIDHLEKAILGIKGIRATLIAADSVEKSMKKGAIFTAQVGVGIAAASIWVAWIQRRSSNSYKFINLLRSTRPALVYAAFGVGLLFISSGILVAMGYKTKPKEIKFPPQNGSFNKNAAEKILLGVSQGTKVDFQAEISQIDELEAMWKEVRDKAKKLVDTCRSSFRSAQELAKPEVIQKILVDFQNHLNKLEKVC